MTEVIEQEATKQLSSMDIKAIRQCSRVSICSNRGQHTIRIIRDVEKKQPFDDDEKVIFLPVNADYVRVNDYTEYDNGGGYDMKTDVNNICGHALIYNYDTQKGVVYTLSKIVKPGDELGLRWIASGNGYTREHGLHIDSVEIVIVRRVKGEMDLISLLMGTSVCPDNSARMIRR